MTFIRKITPKPYFSLSFASRFLTTGYSSVAPDEPSSAYYDELINAAGRDRDFAAVQSLLYRRFRDGCFNTTNTFRFVAVDLSVLDELLRTIAGLDRGFVKKGAYDSLIAALCKSHRPDEALRVANAMLRSDHRPNALTFHPILNALTRKKKMEETRRVMDLMTENQIPPDLTAFNYLLTSYCFSGDLNSAAGLLSEMKKLGLGADTRTYDALVLGACRAGKVDGALAVLRRMVDDGLPVLYSTHAHVIGTLLKMGYHAQAVDFVRIYGGRDKGLDGENYGLLASRLINMKKFDEAKVVLKEMKNKGLSMGHKLEDFFQLNIQ